jgi:hypothetical protein
MKKTLLTSLVVAAATSVFGQGAIDFGNNFGATVYRAPISGPQTNDATASLTGNGSGALYFPTGSTVYNGGFLSGTGFTIGLFAGPQSATESSLVPVALRSFLTGGSSGFITTTTITVPGADAGTQAKYQIRVWNNQGGALATWAQAEAAWLSGLVAAGKSPVVSSGPLGGVNSDGVAFPVNPKTTGTTSFNIYFVPEPSTIALAGLGMASLLIFRRRK